MTIRVVQWTTGSVASNAVRAILLNPDLALVGCYAWSGEKAGKDVGELCGLAPLGITATSDIEELIALNPTWCSTCPCCGTWTTWCACWRAAST